MSVDIARRLSAADAFVGRVEDTVGKASDSLLYAQQIMQKNYDTKHRVVF